MLHQEHLRIYNKYSTKLPQKFSLRDPNYCYFFLISLILQENKNQKPKLCVETVFYCGARVILKVSNHCESEFKEIIISNRINYSEMRDVPITTLAS